MSASPPNSPVAQVPLTLGPFDEPAMARLAADMARIVRPGDCIALAGDLGAGKTSFARPFIRTLAADAGLEVPSPTFTLVQTYPTAPPVAHFDLYRIAEADEVAELGLDEALETGVALIEWPERAASMLPLNALWLTLSEARDEAGADARMITVRGPDEALARLDRSRAVRALLDRAGHGAAHRAPLAGDASMRRYETVSDGDWRAVLMDAPALPDGPPVRDGRPYWRIARLAGDIRPFVAVARTLSEAGFAAPAVLAVDYDRGLALLSHLGADGVTDGRGAPIAGRYEAAIDMLAAMHGRDWPRATALDDGTVHRIRDFDRDAFLIEVDLLVDWFVPRTLGTPATGTDRAQWHALWSALFAVVDAGPRTLMLRDVHSPNILWREAGTGHGRVGLIDFQDALWGHPAYDVMSLAADARVDIPPILQARLLDRYCAARRAADAAFDETGFRAAAAILAAQRICKILGIFVRLDERDGKPAYIAHLPRMKAYLRAALAHPVLADLDGWFEARGLLDIEVVPR